MAIDTETVLGVVKARLNRLPGDTSLDDYLLQRIEAAAAELQRVGIDLADTPDDMMLLVDMTVWQYSNRDKADGMPPWLRLRRRERWLHQRKGGGAS